MLTKEILKDIASKQKENLFVKKNIINRELLKEINFKTNHAIVISGIRRCGKSTLLKTIMKKYKTFNFFNFEDSKLETFSPFDFDKLTSALEELNGPSNIYFFDEIQNAPKWEVYVRSLLDKNKKVILTGSNSALLSKELGTRLTGRNLRYELFPFSFTEYCKYNKFKLSFNSFKKYFVEGGFPEFVQFKEPQILQNVYYDILYRDIVARYSIKNERSLKDLTNYLINNVGKEFSYNSLRKIFSFGTASTPLKYVSYLEDSYILFTVSLFDYSIKKQLVNPKKIYVVDNGFGNNVASKFTSDKGRMLENLVYLELKKRHQKIYYFKNEGECDFVTQDNQEVTNVYQVCYKLTEENLKRELNGLVEAIKKTKSKEYFILTMDQEETFKQNGYLIKAIPVWKWLS